MIKSTVPRFHDPKAAVQSRPVKAEPKKTTATKPAPQSTVKTTAVPTQSRASTATNQSRPKSGVKTKEETKKQVENKENTAPQGLYTDKPSAKLHNFKRSDPFASKNNLKTNSFEYIYNAGGIPCRIDHGSINNRLKWNSGVNLEELSFDPLLVTCFEGLIEEAHPYSFIAKGAAKEMLESRGAAEKTIPLLPKLAFPLRNAFSHRSSTVFENALVVLKTLSNTVGDALDDILHSFLAQIARKLNDKALREKVIDTLHTVEQNGGPNVIKIIKTKVPTYTSVV